MTLQLRPTFSESWYRVANLRAKLRPGAQISRQFYRGERWYVVRDPAGNQFHRLSDPAYRFVALLDGSRTVEAAWDLCGGTLEDDAPTQPEVIQILSHLYSANLIDADVTPDATVLLRRHKQLNKRKMQNRAMNMLFPRIPLWDPDQFLKRWMPINRFIFSKLGALIWLAVVIAAVVSLAPYWNAPGHSLTEAAKSSVDVRNNPVNLILLYGVFVFVKFIHELGHAFSCRRFGGECHELGIMFLVFIPTPYVDASTAWAFPNKWHRIFVGAAGMIVELFFASVAAFVWIATGDIHSIIAQLAFNAMLIASVTTLIFNANPLLRYDGYYILSDFLEIPNLRQKSTEYTLGLIKQHIFKVKLQHPLPPPLQRFWLFTYAVLSSIYRAFVGLVILLIVAYELPVIGPLMALGGVATWFLVPCYKMFKYLATDPELHRKRPRAIAFSLTVAAAVVVVLGLIQFPMNIDAEGVLEVDPADSWTMHIEQPGFVRQIGTNDQGRPLRDGDFVHKGQVIAVLENRPLETQLVVKDAQVRQVQAELMQATAVSPNQRLMKQEELQKTREARDLLAQQVAKLVIKAPIDGELIAPDLGEKMNQYLQTTNKEAFRVENVRNQHVAAVVPQEDFQLLAQQQGRLSGTSRLFLHTTPSANTQVRMVGNIGQVLPAESVQLIQIGRREVPSRAMTQAGGGSAQVDPTDREQKETLVPEFQARVIVGDADSYITGQRAYVRFRLDSKPLIWQWGRRFWQLIEAKGASAKWL
jgi:putative peptide zinc metalloprotease protein